MTGLLLTAGVVAGGLLLTRVAKRIGPEWWLTPTGRLEQLVFKLGSVIAAIGGIALAIWAGINFAGTKSGTNLAGTRGEDLGPPAWGPFVIAVCLVVGGVTVAAIGSGVSRRRSRR